MEKGRFQKHLRRIAHSRELAGELLAACGEESDISRAALLMVWNALFDRLMSADGEELEKLSGIVQRLCASTNQWKTRELKEKMCEERLMKIKETVKNAKAEDGLTAETLGRIEEELNLL